MNPQAPRVQGRPEFPPLRTFIVKRPNYQRVPSASLMEMVSGQMVPAGEVVPEVTEVTVEAHRYYSDNAGALCFEQHVWDTFARTPAARMPICMAPGTWYDVVEISKHLEVRPAGCVN